MYEWAQDFEDGQTRAVCSKCGVPYRWPAELVKLDDGFFYCRRRCLEQTVRTRDRIISQSRKRREMPPPKFVQPPQYAEDHAVGESYIFSFILSAAPADAPGGASDELAASVSAIYLASMVIENRRPTRWIQQARAKLITCADYVLTQQYGNPIGISPSLASTDIRWGGIKAGSLTTGPGLSSVSTATAGRAFVLAYQATGDTKYLTAADACMQFIRGLQCSDRFVTFPTVFPAAGSPYYTGGVSLLLTATGTILLPVQYVSVAALCLRFLIDLVSVRGYSTHYGIESSADFTASTVATLTDIQAGLVSFLTVGASDSVTGTVVAPISMTAPKEYYTPFTPLGGAGTWTSLGSQSSVMATSLYPLYAAGETTFALAVYDWFMSFTSSTASQAPANITPDRLAATNLGTYDPHRALGTLLSVSLRRNVGGQYDWLSAGAMAPLQSIRNPSALAETKRILDGKFQVNKGNQTLFLPCVLSGRSGLSFQPGTGVPTAYYAAEVGMIYRAQPQAFADQYTNPGQS